MRGRIFAGLLLCSLFVIRGDAQRTYTAKTETTDNPVWTMEFIQAKPEKFGLTMAYLDEHWMRIREEAKRQGAVLSYHRISEALLLTPGGKAGDHDSIVLLTEYKNSAAYLGRDKLFASIREKLPSHTPGVIEFQREDLYDTLDTRVGLEAPYAGDPRLKLLAKE